MGNCYHGGSFWQQIGLRFGDLPKLICGHHPRRAFGNGAGIARYNGQTSADIDTQGPAIGGVSSRFSGTGIVIHPRVCVILETGTNHSFGPGQDMPGSTFVW